MFIFMSETSQIDSAAFFLCSNVLDILNMQLQVCDLSEEQVASMDSNTRSFYDEIVSDRAAIESKIRMVADIFTKPVKIGKKAFETNERTKSIFDTAKEYYSKDKTRSLMTVKRGGSFASSASRARDANSQAGHRYIPMPAFACWVKAPIPVTSAKCR